MGTDQRRAILAVVISGVILFGWQYFFTPPVQVTAPIAKTQIVTGIFFFIFSLNWPLG